MNINELVTKYSRLRGAAVYTCHEAIRGALTEQAAHYEQLIQAAVDEAVESRRHEVAMHAVQQIKAEIGQSVPVAGEPVAWVNEYCIDEWERSQKDNWSGARLTAKEVPGSTVPLFRKPTHSIPAAELASLREKAAQLEQEMDDLRNEVERHRWLRDGNDTKKSAAYHIAVNCYGIEWDDAIDAASAQERQP